MLTVQMYHNLNARDAECYDHDDEPHADLDQSPTPHEVGEAVDRSARTKVLEKEKGEHGRLSQTNANHR